MTHIMTDTNSGHSTARRHTLALDHPNQMIMHSYITTFSNGFATTAEAYRQFIRYNNYNHLAAKLKGKLKELDRADYKNLPAIGDEARQLMYCATMPDDVAKAIVDAYAAMQGGPDPKVDVMGIITDANRSPALDGSYHNVSGETGVLDAVQLCFASLYSDKEIRLREQKGIPNDKAIISVLVKPATCSQ